MAELTDAVEVPEENIVEEPKYVTKDDYDRLAGLVSQMQSTLTAGFDALAAQRQVQGRPAEETIDDVTDEELEDALNRGTGAEKFRKMVQAEAKRLQKQHIDPLRQEGHQAIAGLVRQTATASLPHYKRFAKEIDAYIDTLPAQQRLQPEVYKVAHDIVVGGHVEELVAESLEALKRGSGTQVNTPGGQQTRSQGGQMGRQTETQRPPTSDQADILADRGHSPDGFAQRLGYASWDDYMSKTEAYN